MWANEKKLKTPRMITKWLYGKDVPYLKEEAIRLSEKGWDMEIKSKINYSGNTLHALFVLKENR